MRGRSLFTNLIFRSSFAMKTYFSFIFCVSFQDSRKKKCFKWKMCETFRIFWNLSPRAFYDKIFIAWQFWINFIFGHLIAIPQIPNICVIDQFFMRTAIIICNIIFVFNLIQYHNIYHIPIFEWQRTQWTDLNAHCRLTRPTNFSV